MSAATETGNDNNSDSQDHDGGTRRDFMQLTAAAFTAVGLGFVVKPMIESLTPAKDTLALATVEVNISEIPEGESTTIMWQGKPVFIRHRSAAEIEDAGKVDISSLKDPETDADRAQKPKWLVMLGICTHLGCVPLGQKTGDVKGEYNGWFCPCHGSHYDTSGRIRKGPAPRNLEVPKYSFLSDTKVKIGQFAAHKGAVELIGMYARNLK